MEEIFTNIAEFLQTEQALNIIRAILIFVGGYLVARLISSFLVRTMKDSLNPHRMMILQRGSFYIIIALFLTTALVQLGFDLSILLGTAGILTVALAFASQTTMSNLISGIFLIADNPFQVGDILQVGSTAGVVLEVGLLSVNLRKFDNTLVRLPNEFLIKTEFWNLTKFSIRRLDLKIGVAYKEDIERVRDILIDVADQNALSLEEPRPLFIFQGFGESSLDIQFSVWVINENYLSLKNSLPAEIKQAFDAAGVEIPFPHRSLYAGSVTEPFPVKLVRDGNPDG